MTACALCGDERGNVCTAATDHVAVCGQCWALFKAAGFIPFLPPRLRWAQYEWIVAQQIRLAGRRIGNGRNGWGA